MWRASELSQIIGDLIGRDRCNAANDHLFVVAPRRTHSAIPRTRGVACRGEVREQGVEIRESNRISIEVHTVCAHEVLRFCESNGRRLQLDAAGCVVLHAAGRCLSHAWTHRMTSPPSLGPPNLSNHSVPINWKQPRRAAISRDSQWPVNPSEMLYLRK
jgi:hypothetical protein